MDLGLTGRVALITGSSRGIGKATAELFGREGARVALTYCHHPHELEQVVATLRSAGVDALAVPLDLASEDSIRRAVDAVFTRWGRLDVLVNNALARGQMSDGYVLLPNQRDQDWRGLLRANVEGTYLVTDAVIPLMCNAGWGRIVNISSVAADRGQVGRRWYSTAKAALHGLTHTLAKELGPSGILTNVVMPGFTITDGARRQISPETLARRARAAPIRRLLDPTDVAATIVFLSSSANTGINGEIIRMSDGL